MSVNGRTPTHPPTLLTRPLRIPSQPAVARYVNVQAVSNRARGRRRSATSNYSSSEVQVVQGEGRRRPPAMDVFMPVHVKFVAIIEEAVVGGQKGRKLKTKQSDPKSGSIAFSAADVYQRCEGRY